MENSGKICGKKHTGGRGKACDEKRTKVLILSAKIPDSKKFHKSHSKEGLPKEAGEKKDTTNQKRAGGAKVIAK